MISFLNLIVLPDDLLENDHLDETVNFVLQMSERLVKLLFKCLLVCLFLMIIS